MLSDLAKLRQSTPEEPIAGTERYSPGKSGDLSKWVVKVSISDAIYVHGKSGVGLRCTINLSAEHPELGTVMQSTKGCLAFRNRKGEINVMTPLLYLGPAKVKYRPIVLSPGMHRMLQQEFEVAYGRFLVRKDSPDEAPSGVAASFYGAPDSLDLGTL